MNNDLNNQIPNDPTSFSAEPNPQIEVQAQNDFNASMPESFKPKKNFKGLIIGLIVLVVLVVGGIFGSKLLLKGKVESAKEIFEQSINKQVLTMNKAFSELKTLDLFNESIKNEISIFFDLKYSTNMEMLKDFAGYNIKGELGYSNPKKMLAFNGLITDKIGNKFDFNIRGKDNTLYFKLNNIFDKVIKISEVFQIDYDEVIDNTKQKMEFSNLDLEYLLKSISKSIVESMDESKLEKEKVEKTIGNESLNLTRVSYKVDNETLKKMSEKITSDLMNDDKALDILAKTSGATKEDVKKGLKEMYDDYSTAELPETQTIIIDTYISNDYELVAIDFSTETREKYLSYTSLNDVYKITLNDSEFPVDIEYNAKESKTSLNITLSVFDQPLEIQLAMSDKSKETELEQEYNIKIKFDSEYIDLVAKLKMNGQYNFADLDYQNAVFETSLTDVELKQITEKLENHPILKPIFDSMKVFEPSYDVPEYKFDDYDDYNFDY